MRRITVLISTLAFALSGLVISPASADPQVPLVPQATYATPATFASGIQNSSPYAVFKSVSCSTAGNCVAVGQFTNAAGSNEAFTQTQTNGIWGIATPATFASGIQNTNPNSSFQSVSCSTAGNCVAVGQFSNAAGFYEAFTQTQTNGQWGTATPATFASGIQYTDPYSSFRSVSCSSAGNCVAVGQFSNAAGSNEAFTQTQTNGQWGTATPATFASGIQYTDPYSSFRSVSCSSAGNCVAAGYFKNAAFGYEAFTLTQTNGIWGIATPVTFASGIQNTNPFSYFQSVSCSSAGNCVAVGQFSSAAGGYEAFTLTQTNGTWGIATPVTFASGIQNTNPYSFFHSVSCSSAGNCVAVGNFASAAGGYEAVTQVLTVLAATPTPTNNYINSITQAKAWANVDFTLPTLEKGGYDRVAYSINGGSWVSWGLNAKSVQSIKGLPTGREYSIRIRGHVKRGTWKEPSEPVTIFMKKIRGGVVVP